MLSKGVGLFPTEPVGKMCEYVRLCETLEYDNVWFGDSQNIWRESSTVMGAAAVGTEKIVFGTGVTNAVTTSSVTARIDVGHLGGVHEGTRRTRHRYRRFLFAHNGSQTATARRTRTVGD